MTKCKGTGVIEVVVMLTSNLSLFYLLSYLRPWGKHSVSVSFQLRRQNYYDLWDKGLAIGIRTYTIVGGAGTVQL